MSTTRYVIHWQGKFARIEMPRDASREYFGIVQAAFAKAAGARNPKEYAFMTALYNDQCHDGVYWSEGTAGSAGAWFELWDFPTTSQKKLQRCKDYLRRQRDVVRLSVLRLKREIPFTLPEPVLLDTP